MHPLSMDPAQAAKTASYAWRRLSPSAAGPMEMSPYQKAALSNWRDVPMGDAVTRKVAASMTVRYDETTTTETPTDAC